MGLALFLTGSGLNVTCINMMLTQRFTPEDPRREGAFLWNYAGMNVGFFVGFTAAGHYQATESYSSLFIFATIGNFVAIILAVVSLEDAGRSQHAAARGDAEAVPAALQLAGIGILIGLVPVVWFMLQRPGGTETLIKAICAAVALTLIYLTLRHPDRARAAQHDGLPDSDHRLARVLVALPDGAERAAALRGQQRRPDGRVL